MSMSTQIMWIPECDVYEDTECPPTSRCPVSSVPSGKSTFTVDGITVQAWNRADAVATVYRLF